MKKKNILVAMAMLAALSVPANIASAQTLDDRIDEIGVDKAAHFGACYIISDQLARHTKTGINTEANLWNLTLLHWEWIS